MSLFSSLNVALSGLQTTQTLLNTTTRNITNAQTTGYVRETQQAITNVTGGGGVLAGSVQRQVDLTLLNQQWANNAATNYNSTQSALLTQLDNLNGNPSGETNLSAEITALGNAFQQLSANPTDAASANAVLAAAQNLALTFNEQTSTVQNLASTATQNIGTAVTNVNTDLQKIASLNQQVVSGKALGQNVGELQDELNDTVTDLSQYMTVNTYYDNHGYLNVCTANYAPLANNYAEVVSYNGTNNTFSTSTGNITNIGGQLGADQLTVGVNQPASSGNTVTYLTQLGDIAAQLTNGLNNISVPFTGTMTQGSNVISNASGISSLYVGETIDDPSFAAGTTVTGVYTVPTGVASYSGGLTNGSTTMTVSAATAATLALGDAVIDPNVPPGTTIVGISGTNITLSNAATATTTDTINQAYVTLSNAATGVNASFSNGTGQTYTGTVTSGSSRVTDVSNISNVTVGQAFNNSNFPAGTTVTGVFNAAPGTESFQGSTVSGSAKVTVTNNLGSISVGEKINDPNFPAGTTVASINGSIVTMSNAATATVTGATLNVPYVTLSAAATSATASTTSINAQISIPLFQPYPPATAGVPLSYAGALQVSPTITTSDLLVGATNGTTPSSLTISETDPNYAQAAVAAEQFLLNGNATFTAPTIAGTQSFTSALTSQTVAIGQSLSAAQTQATTLGTFGTQITQAIANGSEVNLDTELSNMVVLQNLYASNARVVQTTQKMLDDLLGLIQ